jgi:hypothetical protein
VGSPRIPPYICQNVRYGGIIPYITQIKILGKNLSFFGIILIFVFMDKKTCYICKIEKELNEFYGDKSKSNGVSSKCKKCHNIRAGERKKLKRKNDPEYRKLMNRKRTERLTRRKKEDPEYRKLINRKKEARNVMREERDPVYKLKRKLRYSLRDSFRRKGYTKKTQSYKLLGEEWSVVKEHFESLFTEGMSWDNMGKWHIDHIIPLSSAKNEDEIVKLCHYTNLQPLWEKDNLEKSNKIL